MKALFMVLEIFIGSRKFLSMLKSHTIMYAKEVLDILPSFLSKWVKKQEEKSSWLNDIVFAEAAQLYFHLQIARPQIFHEGAAGYPYLSSRGKAAQRGSS